MTEKQIQESKAVASAIAEKWHEGIKWSKGMLIDHVSYNEWIIKTFPQFYDFVPGLWTDPDTTKVMVGSKVLLLRKFPYLWREYRGHPDMPPFLREELDYRVSRSRLKTWSSGGRQGWVSFSDDVLIPNLVEANGMDCWMSLTPMEIMSQRSGIRRAKGNVLVGGMGMGWFARRVLERKKVEHVTVVDIDKDVLHYFGDPLRKEFGSRLRLVHDDIYNLDAFKYDSYLSDIWPAVNSMPYDRKFQAIKAAHPNAWGWGYDLKQSGGGLWG